MQPSSNVKTTFVIYSSCILLSVYEERLQKTTGESPLQRYLEDVICWHNLLHRYVCHTVCLQKSIHPECSDSGERKNFGLAEGASCPLVEVEMN